MRPSTYSIICLLSIWIAIIDGQSSNSSLCDVQMNGSCFFLASTQATYSDAEFECYAKNATLAVLNATASLDPIVAMLQRKGSTEVFIGLTDRIQRGTFRWHDTAIETNEGLIVPESTVPQNTEACITQTSAGYWKRSLCNVPNDVLCQVKNNTKPTAPVRQWSQWVSLSSPNKADQVLTIENLIKTYPNLCVNPDNVQCRVKNTTIPSNTTGDKLQMPCSRNGLICLNSDQLHSTKCNYYELRILCPIDFNECASKDLNQCDVNAKCINTYGSYKCVCQSGFIGNGFTCFKVNKCVAHGDPHYISFDQVVHNFMGVCYYRLAETCIKNTSLINRLQTFKITSSNEYRGSNIKVSYSKSVTLYVFNNTIELSKGNRLSINGIVVNPPQSITINDSEIGITVVTAGLQIQTSFGLSVVYDGDSKITVYVPDSYSGQMCGLCGNMNGNPNDEWMLSNGTQTSDRDVWGNSWMAPNQNGTICAYLNNTLPNDLCDSTTNDMVKGQCSRLTSKTGPFAACQTTVDPQTIYPSCYFDVCSDPHNKDLLCNSYKLYADTCAEHGILLDWRAATQCAMTCGSNQHYEFQTSGCQASCQDPNAPNNCHIPDVSGCVCNDGFLLSGTVCIPKEKCGCYDSSKTYRMIGDVWYGPNCTVKNKCTWTGDIVQDTHVQCSHYGECYQRPSDGSYDCRCKVGFEGLPDNCTEIDECTANTHACNDAANCINLLGNYTCSCKEGFTGDGFTCTNINECLTGPTNCSLYATCYDTDGSYRCVCNTGYEGDGISCSEPPITIANGTQEGCSFNADATCHQLAECYDLPDGSFQCVCIEGSTGDGMKGTNHTGCSYAPCPTNSYPFKGYCYTLITSSQNQSMSEKICNNQGGHLATFIDPIALQFMVQNLEIFSSNIPYYIGYSFLTYQNVCTSIDFSTTTVKNWASGNPNPNLPCVVLLPRNATSPYAYMSVNCSKNYGAICKFAASPRKCPEGWREIKDKCTSLTIKPLNMISAAIECSRFGGDLATILSQNESSILFTRVLKLAEGSFWFGLNKNLLQRSSSFQWWNDTDIEYISSTANATAPTILTPPDLECFQILPNRQWYSVSCNNLANGYLCERPQNVFYRCPPSSGYFNGMCYKTSSNGSQSVSEQSCIDAGGQLTSIATFGEQSFLESYLPLIGAFNSYWIGVQESVTQAAIYSWTDYTEFEYTNWNKNEPNMTSMGNCVIIEASANSKLPWSEEDCSLNFHGLCKYLNTPCNQDSDCNTNGQCHMGQCRCNKVFSGDGLNSCGNIDECSAPVSPCSENEVCSDTIGSYNCNCIDNYVRLSNGTCLNALFCLGDADCAKNGKCYQNLCTCIPGYQGDGKLNCTDTDECLSLNNTKCSINATCINNFGDYMCVCKPGYHGTGTECHVNEKNCHEYLMRHPTSTTGVYSLDPDAFGPLGFVNTYCEMRPNLGITQVRHDNMVLKKITSPTFLGENRTIKYELTLPYILAIKASSAFCYQDMQFQCQGVMSLLESTRYVDVSGTKRRRWGSSTIENLCGCGELKTCKNFASPCFCDGSYTATSYDNGRIIDKSLLPVTNLLTGGVQANRTGSISLGALKCGPQQFDIPKDCNDAKVNYSVTMNDVYWIDVDQNGLMNPFKVMCDVKTKPFGITIVPHNKIPGNYPPTMINNLPGPLVTTNSTVPSSSTCFNYPVNDATISQLIANSGGCTQEVKYDCKKGAQLLNGKAYLITINNQSISYFGGGSNGACACGVLGTCANNASSCNCDGSSDNSDFGFIRNKNDLPVKCFVDNNTPSTSSIMSVGPLMCGPGPFGLEPSCHEWVKRGYNISYTYLIDPDGGNINNVSTNIPEFLVHCKMTPFPPRGITTIPSSMPNTSCTTDKTRLCKHQAVYPMTTKQLAPLISRSAYCVQRIKYTCQKMTLLTPYGSNPDPYSYWRTYGSETTSVNYNYFSGNGTIKAICDCGLKQTCKRCFCDSNTTDVKVDEGYLINKLNLPVGAVWVGYDPSVANLTSLIEIGNLECFETFPTCDSYMKGFKTTTEKPTRYNTFASLDPDGPFGDGPILGQCQDSATYIYPAIQSVVIDDTNATNIGPSSQCMNITYQYLPILNQLKTLSLMSKSCLQYMKLSCTSTPLTNYVQWYDNNGISRPGWAGNADGTQCACGEVDACQGGSSYSCNCDSMSSNLTYDHGLLVNKKILPVTKVCAGLTETLPPRNVHRQLIFEIGPLTCTENELVIQPDCQRLRENQYQDVYRSPNFQSEAWIIDPDSDGPGNPFTAYCDMKTDLPVGITVLKTVLNQTTCSTDPLPSTSQIINIGYLAATKNNIANLTSVSSYCEQGVTYKCNNAQLFDGNTFGAYDLNGSYINYWLGPQDVSACDNNTCSCNINDNANRTDSGMFTDKTRLPLSQIQIPNVSGRRQLCINELRCYNLPTTCDQYSKQGRLSSSKGNRNNIWAIDPDQGGGEKYFGVLCTTIGSSIVSQVLQTPTTLVLTNSSASGQSSVIPYTNSTMIQIHKLVNISYFCSQRMDYFCANYGSLNNGGPTIMDYSNTSVRVWAGADGYNMSEVCACSILGTCPPSQKCRCDAPNTKQYEGGVFTNKAILPLQQLTYRANSTINSKIYSVQCSTAAFGLPVDCIQAYSQGYLNDTEVLIMPVGASQPFLVSCLMNSGTNNGMRITVLPSTILNTTIQPIVNITYPSAIVTNAKTLTSGSSYCLQAIKFTCLGVTFSTSFTWVDSTSSKRTGYGTESLSNFCPCSQQQACYRVIGESQAMMTSRKCNCDISDSTVRVETNLITNKAYLPIQSVLFSATNVSSQNLLQIGPLMCSNSKFDFDECKYGFNECDVNANCTNTDSGYTCQCRAGWQGLGGNEIYSNGRHCIDDNECNMNLCPSVSKCTNTPGSFFCVCNSGYVQTAPTVCKDIDECKLNVSVCDTNAQCLNTNGSYICLCKTGYRGSGQPGQCQPIGACTCWGDPHCLSFDGEWLHYQGLCTYTLARDNCEKGLPKRNGSPSFEVLMKNWDQNQNSHNQVSWAKELTINVLNYTIMMKLNLDVTVNGQLTSLPFIPKLPDGTPVGIEVSYYGFDVRLTTSNGVEIKWDGISQVDVTVGKQMQNQMCGLCGNFNSNATDDWIIGPACSNSGAQTDLLNLFGDSWTTNDDPTCKQVSCRESPNETPCAVDIMTKAQLECTKLKTLFAVCGKEMAVLGKSLDDYLQSCTYDYCHTTGDLSVMICNTASSLAKQCLNQYKVVVNYRSPNFCNFTCGANMVYTTCALPCQPTCNPKANLSLCSNDCSEGCICASGYVMDNGQCIKPSQCGCNMPDGTYYQNGENRTNDNCTEVCSCNGATGQLGCAEIQCSNYSICGFKNDDFSCHCKDGFMGDGFKCADINECTLVPSVCDVNAKCNNTIGSYTCTCKEGFEGNGVNCSNINECSPKSPCQDVVEECFDKVPGYQCLCVAGTMRNASSGKCEDKDECADTGNLCDRVSTSCNNTFGSYRCECRYGFRPNPVDSYVCIDVDECHLVHDCDKNFAKCTNIPGSYLCTCNYGYQGDGRNCTDINECISDHVCQRPDSTCENLDGSYRCLCLDGKPGCDGPNPCDSVKCNKTNEICYLGECQCEHGYSRNDTTGQCDSIDACGTNIHNCTIGKSNCVNIPGGYRCDCLYGYQMVAPNNSCENINECLQDTHRCGQNADCIDTDGGYFCQCKMGFTGHCDECRDIDECGINENKCDKTFGNCFNTIGSYRCECRDGFFGDGSSCSDINECTVGLHNCTDPKSFCLNTIGSYSCSCSSGYGYDISGKCLDINECAFADNGCDENANCKNVDGSFQCNCKDGFVGTGRNCTPEAGRTLCGKILCPFSSDCVNSTCVCRTGFRKSGNKCIDINECDTNHTCDPNAECINIHGSYVCHCSNGFVGNGFSCVNKTTDNDACQTKDYCIDGNCYDGLCHCSNGYTLKDNRCIDDRCTNACPPKAICSTSTGTKICTCPSGTSLSTDGSECSDIDECSENYDDCQLNSLCLNIYGSYQCHCPPGYLDVFRDGKICKPTEPSNCNLFCAVGQYCNNDVCHCLDGLNETISDNVTTCEKKTVSCANHTCPPNSICQERLFGFLCQCQSGYDSVGLTSCKDIDECNINTHNCSSKEICANTLGSFTCSCKPGYSRDNSSGSCKSSTKCNCEHNGVCDKDGKCVCNPGFGLNAEGNCDDIDECMTKPPCHILARCDNSPGSYNCSCPDNFYGDPETRCIEDLCVTKQLICAPDEECQNGIYGSACVKQMCKSNEIVVENECVPATKACQTQICKSNAVCKVTNGRADCFCDSGYFGDGDSCSDIDECSSGTVTCPPNSRCQNKPGSYYCGCDSGFVRSGSNSSTELCVDINECDIENSCAINAKCSNQVGSFLCQCKDGYIGDGKYSCRLDSKCDMYDNCHHNAACILDATTSLYTCKCDSGYSGDGINSCIKTNLCNEDGQSKCNPNADCLQVNSTYRCVCKAGFQGDGYQFCSDVDECANSSVSRCLPLEKCINYHGGYNCTCGDGATIVDGICQDINECNGTANSKCSPFAICNNTLGGHTCQCKDGFYGDGINCHDIDECRLGSANCSSNSLCVNEPGSFACQCQAGTKSNGTTCVDEDECLKQKNNVGGSQCDVNAVCSNKNPGFECICKDGYRGTGWFCVKNNPCDKPQACSKNETCVPSDDYSNATCQCKNGFERVNDTCIPAKLCATGKNTCNKNTENCIQLDPGFSCECKPGFKTVGTKCQDKDECNPQFPDFAAEQCAASESGCLNTNGSFICICTAKQIETGDGCKPIDFCANGLDSCDKNVEDCVTNRGSSYSCPCKPGFTKVNGVCTDTDECANDMHECKNNATCVNILGSYNCSCPSTMVLLDSGNSCKDRNECLENPFICGDHAKCINLEGSHSCVCVSGYQWNGNSCEDIDECKNRTNPCHEFATCSNIAGSCTCKCYPGYDGDGIYRCQETDRCPSNVQNPCPPGSYCNYKNSTIICECLSGYSYVADISCNDTVCLKKCDDIDECLTNKTACHPLAKCVNNDGAYVCQCPPYLIGDGKTTCEDKDECVLEEHMCNLNTSVCVNNNNTLDVLNPFQCICLSGYVKVPGTELCVDKNECSNPTDNDCQPNSKCVDTDGGFECQCINGYKSMPGRKCVDINECQDKTFQCDLYSTCQNTDGGYKCHCKSGFQPSLNSSQICEDINECINPLSCINISNSICVNLPGEFSCVCPYGFERQGGSCIDVDECLINNATCKTGSKCVNIAGGFICQCPKMMRKLPDGSCEAINECMEGSDQCAQLNGKNSTCYDLPVGYGCVCPKGFVNNPSSAITCVDLNECATNSHNCLVGTSTCKNTYGGFKCVCKSGFSSSSNGTCEDVNECEAAVATGKSVCKNGNCVNSPGGYSCECDSGFQLVNGHCVDIDECNADRNSLLADDCDQDNGNCTNVAGGFNCTCQKGYQLSTNSSKCEDVDECSYENSCLNGICSNRLGIFECICLSGFRIVNDKCTDIDECTVNPVVCGVPSSGVCINTMGSYKCYCSQGYDNSGGKITSECFPINECVRQNVTCPPNAQCVDQDLGYQCLCKDGYQEDQIGICRNINECLLESSCHYLADCVDTDGSFECYCKLGYTGDGKKSCTPICGPESCLPYQMCQIVNKNQFQCGCSCQGPNCSDNVPVCDKYGVTYTSERIMYETACKENKTNEVEYYHDCQASCDKVVCPNTEICSISGSKPSCNCPSCTTDEMKPRTLCSSNGIEFQSLCQMKTWICETKSIISMSYLGPCRRAIDCEMSKWSEWSDCTKTCGIGNSKRTRTIIAPARFNGKCTAATVENQNCYNGPCPGDMCENMTCNPGSMCEFGKCSCPDCSGLTTTEPVCGSIGKDQAGTYRSYCTLEHNACILNSSFVYIHKGYCGEHVPSEPKICTVVTDFKIIVSSDNCTSVAPVRTNLCSGGCGLNPNYCCRAFSSRILRVKFRCQDNSFVFKEVKSIASCDCKLEEATTPAI